jgi:hypothetical protein
LTVQLQSSLKVRRSTPCRGKYYLCPGQQRSLWAFPAVDGERDDAYREDDDPAEESEPSGTGDHDGILEQVGWCDNQFTVMA